MKCLHAYSLVWTPVSQLASCIHSLFESGVHFDKTHLWFGFTFVSLVTTSPFSRSTHKSSVSSLYPSHSTSILHLLLHIPKTSFSYHCFYPETIIPGILWVRTKKSECLMLESDTLRNIASDVICLYVWCIGTRKNERYLQEKNAWGNISLIDGIVTQGVTVPVNFMCTSNLQTFF
jgi:hypothetical protein